MYTLQHDPKGHYLWLVIKLTRTNPEEPTSLELNAEKTWQAKNIKAINVIFGCLKEEALPSLNSDPTKQMVGSYG